MKYQQPAGAVANAPYVDGNRSAGVRGSIVPGKAIEHGMRELVHLITYSGQTPNETDLEQVRKAIEALISAAVGSGDTALFVLMSQARARLPIFPEILTPSGKMFVTSPSTGSVLVPDAVNFLHRGIFLVSTSDTLLAARTFATSPSKTYHLRWNPTDGFVLKDLANSGYNPSLLAEANSYFDSSYDDMLIARVVTSAGNVATITNLANKNRLQATVEKTTVEVTLAPTAATSFQIDFARTPRAYLSLADVSPASLPNAELIIGFTRTVNRYGGTARTLGFVPENPAEQRYVNGLFILELDA